MDRIWKKLTLRIKDESYREQVYWWFQDQKPYGFWEKDSLTIVAYVRDWPEESFPEYIVAAERDEEPDENWAKEWRKRFKPIVVNETIVIRPPWNQQFLQRLIWLFILLMHLGPVIIQQPFLVWNSYPNFLNRDGILDVGMGSGILSLLAFRLGAGDITSIDIDPLAMEELKRNCALNQIPFERIKSKSAILPV